MTSLQFYGSVSIWTGLFFAIAAGVISYWLYRQETLRLGSPWGRTLPGLRSVAIALVVLMLTGPTIQQRYREGDPGQLTILIDDSESMTLSDGETSDRYERAIQGLTSGEQSVLKTLANEHEIQVIRGSKAIANALWTSTLTKVGDLPSSTEAWRPDRFGTTTSLGTLLAKENSSAIVLISDGQMNDGLSLEEVARTYKIANKPIFTIGMGSSESTEDITLLSIDYPDRLFRKDSLTGNFVVQEALPEGTPYLLRIVDGETIVWSESILSQGRGRRSISFTFPIEKITERFAKDSKNAETGGQGISASGFQSKSAVAIDLTGQIVMNPGIAISSGPSRTAASKDSLGEQITKQQEIRFWSSLHRAKVLLLDGRSRWETRYLKNLFDRDSFWDLTTVIADPEAVAEGRPIILRGSGNDKFPESEEDLLDCDLIILGEFPFDTLTDEEKSWVHRFVIASGGGLVIVDGRRDHWSESNLGLLSELLPVSRGSISSVTADNKPESMRGPRDSDTFTPTNAAKKLAAFQLRGSNDRRLEESSITPDSSSTASSVPLGDWQKLPKLVLNAKVLPLPGSEILATLGSPNVQTNQPLLPVMVTKINGAGRVLYSATDETWRWRYKVGDEVHQRFWNQMARWVMRTPYSVQNDYVSLDAGKMNYRQGQDIEIQCRLRDSEGLPLITNNVEAIITLHSSDLPNQKQAPIDRPSSISVDKLENASRETVETSSIVLSLSSDPALPGVYKGTATALADGEYNVSVSAIGLPQEAMQLTTRFVVKATESTEMQETTNNSTLLRKVAEISGGQYIPENQMDKLVELLKPLSGGRIVQNEISLWQSFWWFIPIVSVLSIEWWLRKKSGLL